jgi:hypothetical protein
VIANRWFCNRARRSAATDLNCFALLFCALACCSAGKNAVAASKAPDWMHIAAAKPQPTYNVETQAVLLYSDTSVNVVSKNKMRTHVRQAYRILRPEGREHGNVSVYTSGRQKVTFLRAWCIPAKGQDYEVTERNASERSPLASASGLYFDTKAKSIRVPAPDPGSVVGYEYETEDDPFFLQDLWNFQGFDPVLESHYRLELPPEWRFRESWVHHAAVEPVHSGDNTWGWTLTNVEGIRPERQMPPLCGVAGKMVISFLAPGSTPDPNAFATWSDMGRWYSALADQRLDASDSMKRQVATLTEAQPEPAVKMRAIAQFLQSQIRYVAVELGIGSWQPHAAADVFTNRYGDCKDKATLAIAMLKQLGIDSYYVIINTKRGAVGSDEPAHNGFNHVIVAIPLTDKTDGRSFVATIEHPRLGRLLFFDPTDEVTPFGKIRGALQANYGLLVHSGGGELVRLPQADPALNSTKRTGKMALEPDGTLYGEVEEIRTGDYASEERGRLRVAHTDSDRLKPFETLLADSFGLFRLIASRFDSVGDIDTPLSIRYAFQAPAYGKNAGDMLLVRPRVLGSKSSGLLETDELRRFAIELDAPSHDSDMFEIALPAGYEVVDMAPPVDADFGFANYHSRTEVAGNILRYTRTFEVRDVSVPADKADNLKKLYRIIATDERSTVVLKKRMQAKQ